MKKVEDQIAIALSCKDPILSWAEYCEWSAKKLLEPILIKTMYTYRDFYIPIRMMGSLERWIKHGIKPGNFLTAVLENNLRESFERADDENSQNIPAYLAYLYNECPADSWGSKEKVAAWQEKKLSERTAD